MKIAILLTGNELMSGDTVDTNSNYFAQSLRDINQMPFIKQVVGDDLHLLQEAIESLTAKADVLLINGGLGPTVDDMTAQAVARAAGVELVQYPDALRELEKWAAKRNFVLTKANLKQADLPAGSDIIVNPHGSAVGFTSTLNDCLLMATPGVPFEFKAMVDTQILPMIQTLSDSSTQATINRLRLFGITESGLQDMISAAFPNWPNGLDLGFRVQMPVIELKVTSFESHLRALNQQWTDRLLRHFSDYIIGRDSTRLPQALNHCLKEAGLTLALAESCTGGAIAAAITSEAGSSEVFKGAVVAYHNNVKQHILDVPATSLQTEGAVSEAVVTAMVKGVCAQLDADLGFAISGVAGPDGGTPEKPVGTVWMAWGDANKVSARAFFLPMTRAAFQRTAAAIGIDLIRRHVLGLPIDVDYFAELKKTAT